MALARTIKNLKRSELIVTPVIDEWLLRNPEGMVLNDEAKDLVWDILKAAMGANNDRSGRFGASSRGTCYRRQILSFLGMRPVPSINTVTSNLFNDGKWRHIKWQIMGYQAGIFTHVEFPASLPKYRVKISMDALNSNECWFFELKGASNYTGKALEPVSDPHLDQIHTCMLVTGWDRAVYVMEDKRSQEWKETVVYRDEQRIRNVRRELMILNEHVESQTLPPILNECHVKKGAYRSCPYNKFCLAQEDNHGDEWPTTETWGHK